MRDFAQINSAMFIGFWFKAHNGLFKFASNKFKLRIISTLETNFMAFMAIRRLLVILLIGILPCQLFAGGVPTSYMSCTSTPQNQPQPAHDCCQSAQDDQSSHSSQTVCPHCQSGCLNSAITLPSRSFLPVAATANPYFYGYGFSLVSPPYADLLRPPRS